ncbi:MAG: capsular exopolysaccharide family [Candidatus Acidoferrum typicum]|nr:capsular exopolysaccharide family [Candidatus Acidoferrum typicum]
MSKVHEALKRAQEERSSAIRPVAANGNDTGIAEETAGRAGEQEFAAQAGGFPDAARVAGNVGVLADVSTNGRTTNEIVTPSIAITKTPLPAERRPHAPAQGRDPRTGQFLRFEDLLRNCSKPTWVLDPRIVAFCAPMQQASCTEPFRTLRTRLYQLRETAPLKKVLITSALAGEGKTFVVTNLGQAIARERERKVLLIDADLRNPSLHKPLGAPLSPGLSDYLRGEASDPEIIQHGQEGNLCFIPAGNPGRDPSELLSNGMLDKLLDRVAPLFDWVIIDSPPCLPVADANLIGGLCDGVLLVLRAQSTPSAAAEKARKELQKRKVVGVVVNFVEENQTYGDYYGHDGDPGSPKVGQDVVSHAN